MKKSTIGGQAVIEGVMMRSPHHMALAVRRDDGEIVVETKRITPLADKNKAYGAPLVRGAVNMGSMLVQGVKILNRSIELAGIAEEEPSRFEKWLAKHTKRDIMDIMMVVAVAMAAVLAIGLFVFLPSLAARGFQTFIRSSLWVNVLEGVTRLLIVGGYLAAISRMKDIQRVLAYHGAEHKVVNCYENDLDLTIENARAQSVQHPRCGTSFLFIVVIVSVVIFSLFGAITNLWLRMLTRILLLPLVAGVSYEVLRGLSASDSKLAGFFRRPGMWFQKMTAKEPDDKMLEVALASFKAVMDADERMQRAHEEKEASDAQEACPDLESFEPAEPEIKSVET
ncbi:MAG: DUF1385 domain-containing protein [Christensenellales bacterium]